MKTFVYDGVEVKKTGRTAAKVIKLPQNRTKEIILFEITPCSDFDWKKWVPDDQLYEVRD